VIRAEEFDWSSHRYYLTSEAPEWLRRGPICELVGGSPASAGRRLDEYIRVPIDPQIMKQIASPRWAAALGDDAFVGEMRARLKEGSGPSSALESEEAEIERSELEEILRAACLEFGKTREELVSGKRGTTNVPRLVTILTCRDATPAKARLIGEVFGIAAPTVAVLAGRTRALTLGDEAVGQALARLKARLENADV